MAGNGEERRSSVPACRVPGDHLDLLQGPLLGILATLLPDDQPQTQPVWFSYEAPCVLINTMRDFRKERNLRANPRATLLIIDPENIEQGQQHRVRGGATPDD